MQMVLDTWDKQTNKVKVTDMVLCTIQMVKLHMRENGCMEISMEREGFTTHISYKWKDVSITET